MRYRFGVAAVALLMTAVSGEAASGALSSVGNISHLAWGAGWQTVLFLSNYGAADATVAVNFYGDDGAAVGVPWTRVFTEDNSLTGAPITSLNVSVKAGGMAVFLAGGDSGDPGDSGWGSAQVLSDVSTIKGGVDFKYNSGNMHGEAMVMADQGGAKTWDTLFFSEDGYAGCGYSYEFTSYAIANTSSAPVTFTRTINDRITGEVVLQDQQTLAARGHMAFLANDLIKQPPDAGTPAKLWTMRISAPGANQITMLTLHFRQSVGGQTVDGCQLGPLVFESVPLWEIE